LRHGQEDRAIGEVWPADHVVDAVEESGASGLKQDFVIIRIKLPHGQAATARKTT
jgi:hypothetical protein